MGEAERIGEAAAPEVASDVAPVLGDPLAAPAAARAAAGARAGGRLAPPPGDPGMRALLALQAGAGNRALSRVIARDPAPPATPELTPGQRVAQTFGGKIPIRTKEIDLAKRDVGWATLKSTIQGEFEFEIIAAGGGPNDVNAKSMGVPITTPKPGAKDDPQQGAQVRVGVTSTQGERMAFMAEVEKAGETKLKGTPFEYQPKAKIGVEGNREKVSVGMEVKAEGLVFSPSFAFTMVGKDESGWKVLTGTAAIEGKFPELEAVVDGVKIKAVPKVTVRFTAEPNWRRLALTVAEEMGADGVMALAAVLAPIAGAAFLMGVGVVAAETKGELHRGILEKALDAKASITTYVLSMNGADAPANGPIAKKALARAQADKAAIAAQRGMTMEQLEHELSQESVPPGMWDQVRSQVLGNFDMAVVTPSIQAYRTEHYVVAAFTECADDVAEVEKLYLPIFNRV